MNKKREDNHTWLKFWVISTAIAEIETMGGSVGTTWLDKSCFKN